MASGDLFDGEDQFEGGLYTPEKFEWKPYGSSTSSTPEPTPSPTPAAAPDAPLPRARPAIPAEDSPRTTQSSQTSEPGQSGQPISLAPSNPIQLTPTPSTPQTQAAQAQPVQTPTPQTQAELAKNSAAAKNLNEEREAYVKALASVDRQLATAQNKPLIFLKNLGGINTSYSDEDIAKLDARRGELFGKLQEIDKQIEALKTANTHASQMGVLPRTAGQNLESVYYDAGPKMAEGNVSTALNLARAKDDDTLGNEVKAAARNSYNNNLYKFLPALNRTLNSADAAVGELDKVAAAGQGRYDEARPALQAEFDRLTASAGVAEVKLPTGPGSALKAAGAVETLRYQLSAARQLWGSQLQQFSLQTSFTAPPAKDMKDVDAQWRPAFNVGNIVPGTGTIVIPEDSQKNPYVGLNLGTGTGAWVKTNNFDESPFGRDGQRSLASIDDEKRIRGNINSQANAQMLREGVAFSVLHSLTKAADKEGWDNASTVQHVKSQLDSLSRGGSRGAASTPGVAKFMERLNGLPQDMIDKIDTQLASFNSVLAGTPTGQRISNATIGQLKNAINNIYAARMDAIGSTLGGDAREAGSLGLPISRLGVSRDIQDVVRPHWEAGRRETLENLFNADYVVDSGGRLVLRQPMVTGVGEKPAERAWVKGYSPTWPDPFAEPAQTATQTPQAATQTPPATRTPQTPQTAEPTEEPEPRILYQEQQQPSPASSTSPEGGGALAMSPGLAAARAVTAPTTPTTPQPETPATPATPTTPTTPATQPEASNQWQRGMNPTAWYEGDKDRPIAYIAAGKKDAYIHRFGREEGEKRYQEDVRHLSETARARGAVPVVLAPTSDQASQQRELEKELQQARKDHRKAFVVSHSLGSYSARRLIRDMHYSDVVPEGNWIGTGITDRNEDVNNELRSHGARDHFDLPRAMAEKAWRERQSRAPEAAPGTPGASEAPNEQPQQIAFRSEEAGQPAKPMTPEALLRSRLAPLPPRTPAPAPETPESPQEAQAGPKLEYVSNIRVKDRPYVVHETLAGQIREAARHAGIVRVVVTSAGQDSEKTPGARRTSAHSVNHDLVAKDGKIGGGAADVELYAPDGHKLRVGEPRDEDMLKKFVTKAAELGVSGFGGSANYQDGNLHVGGGARPETHYWGGPKDDGVPAKWLPGAAKEGWERRGWTVKGPADHGFTSVNPRVALQHRESLRAQSGEVEASPPRQYTPEEKIQRSRAADAHIESYGDPNKVRLYRNREGKLVESQYKGLYQLSSKQFDEYNNDVRTGAWKGEPVVFGGPKGEEGWRNPAYQERVKEWREAKDGKILEAAGFENNGPNRYILHNQGAAGGPALLRAAKENPNAPAWRVVKEAAPKEPDPLTNISGNVLASDFKRFTGQEWPGSASKVTASQLVKYWTNKHEYHQELAANPGAAVRSMRARQAEGEGEAAAGGMLRRGIRAVGRALSATSSAPARYGEPGSAQRQAADTAAMRWRDEHPILAAMTEPTDYGTRPPSEVESYNQGMQQAAKMVIPAAAGMAVAPMGAALVGGTGWGATGAGMAAGGLAAGGTQAGMNVLSGRPVGENVVSQAIFGGIPAVQGTKISSALGRALLSGVGGAAEPAIEGRGPYDIGLAGVVGAGLGIAGETVARAARALPRSAALSIDALGERMQQAFAEMPEEAQTTVKRLLDTATDGRTRAARERAHAELARRFNMSPEEVSNFRALADTQTTLAGKRLIEKITGEPARPQTPEEASFNLRETARGALSDARADYRFVENSINNRTAASIRSNHAGQIEPTNAAHSSYVRLDEINANTARPPATGTGAPRQLNNREKFIQLRELRSDITASAAVEDGVRKSELLRARNEVDRAIRDHLGRTVPSHSARDLEIMLRNADRKYAEAAAMAGEHFNNLKAGSLNMYDFGEAIVRMVDSKSVKNPLLHGSDAGEALVRTFYANANRYQIPAAREAIKIGLIDAVFSSALKKKEEITKAANRFINGDLMGVAEIVFSPAERRRLQHIADNPEPYYTARRDTGYGGRGAVVGAYATAHMVHGIIPGAEVVPGALTGAERIRAMVLSRRASDVRKYSELASRPMRHFLSETGSMIGAETGRDVNERTRSHAVR